MCDNNEEQLKIGSKTNEIDMPGIRHGNGNNFKETLISNLKLFYMIRWKNLPTNESVPECTVDGKLHRARNLSSLKSMFSAVGNIDWNHQIIDQQQFWNDWAIISRGDGFQRRRMNIFDGDHVLVGFLIITDHRDSTSKITIFFILREKRNISWGK